MESECRKLMEPVTGKQLIRDYMESKDNFEWRNQNNCTNGIYEIDGANTTDGGIVIHGADLYDEIDGTYENKRKVFFYLCSGISETK